MGLAYVEKVCWAMLQTIIMVVAGLVVGTIVGLVVVLVWGPK